MPFLCAFYMVYAAIFLLLIYLSMYRVNDTMHNSEEHGMKPACMSITPTSDTGELYKTLNELVDYSVFQFLGL